MLRACGAALPWNLYRGKYQQCCICPFCRSTGMHFGFTGEIWTIQTSCTANTELIALQKYMRNGPNAMPKVAYWRWKSTKLWSLFKMKSSSDALSASQSSSRSFLRCVLSCNQAVILLHSCFNLKCRRGSQWILSRHISVCHVQYNIYQHTHSWKKIRR